MPAKLDPVSLDLIENALRNARHEMDAVLFRSAMSPVIREQHDEFPMITDPRGRMIVGQFGSYVNEMLAEQKFELEPGDVILQSDPYKCGGAISHINDWMVLVPVFHQGELVGFTSMFGHMMDVGGWVPGSMPTDATSIFGEGTPHSAALLYERGELNKAVLDLIMNNTRTPEMNYSDLMAIIAGCRAGEKRVIEICDRFGRETYKQACDALLERTNRAMRKLIVQNLAGGTEVVRGLCRRRRPRQRPVQDEAHRLARRRQRLFRLDRHFAAGARADQLLSARRHVQDVHRGLHDHGVRPPDPVQRRLLRSHSRHHAQGLAGASRTFRPRWARRTHALSRQFDVLGGALSYNAPEMATAAGYGSSPHFLYSGVDKAGRPFQLMEILYGGIPGRPIGDGMDGHSWWPLFQNIPSEYLETYYPMLIEGYTTIIDTGGAGKHRGGNGVEKIYLLLEEGDISIHDDRHASQPWGILGGRPGACSEKWLVRKDGTRQPLPSKIDNVRVYAGDRRDLPHRRRRRLGRSARARSDADPQRRRPQADDRNEGARRIWRRSHRPRVLSSIAAPPTNCATACGGIEKLRSCSISESASANASAPRRAARYDRT